jgi:aminopeptidase-like protein
MDSSAAIGTAGLDFQGNPGAAMHALATELYPICRSITGNGVRQTLEILRRELPALKTFEVPSGTQCFDWVVPPEWNIRDGYILAPDGKKIIDFKQHNLHVVGYSTPIDATLNLDALRPHLYSLPDQPDAIPYMTSYYKERWGFCLTHQQLQSLQPGDYRVKIDSTLAPGNLTYAELVISGDEPHEVFISTYVCHPSMGNNELSGPVVTTALAKWLQSLPRRRYTYRIVFIPETIGSIVYLSRNLQALKQRVIAGFNVTCIGDDRAYSYLPTRLGGTLSDRAALHALRHQAGDFQRYSYLDRGSDERQYCSPGADLPMASIMRSKYAMYPEYHTSKDDLSFITPSGLGGGFEALRKAVMAVEANASFRATTPCEPNLGKRGLYPTLSTKDTARQVRSMMNVLAYADGAHDLLAVAEMLEVPVWDLAPIAAALEQHGLLERLEDKNGGPDHAR